MTSSEEEPHHQQEQHPHRTPTAPAPAPDTLISPPLSLQYWSRTPASLTGILGGYPQISLTDLRGSRTFLTKLRRGPSGAFTPSSHKRLKLGVDCGAGIGRVTAGLLRHVCESVDVVEPVGRFAEVVRRARGEGRVGRVWVVGLQDWDPDDLTSLMVGGEGQEEKGGVVVEKYDLIWNQWCLGHLTDSQLTAYLRRCGHILRQDDEEDGGGWIVVKENMSTDPDGEDIYDDVDSSVTRTDEKFRHLFEAAGLEIVRTELQMGFPKGLGLYPVRMYGLRPKRGGTAHGI